MKIEFESFEDMKKFLDDLGYDIQPKESKKRPMTNAEKQKAYRERKKVMDGNEAVTESNATGREEREEEEAGSSPLSPSSLPSFPSDSPNNYPITPYNPPLPEEKGEREEIFGDVSGKRGELMGFGNHVKLSREEYMKLLEKFGSAKLADMIRNMNNYIGEDPKLQKKYETRNHYLTLLNWARRDEKMKPQSQQKKTYTFSEIVAMKKQNEGEVIDL